MDVSTIFYICRYCVFTLWERLCIMQICHIVCDNIEARGVFLVTWVYKLWSRCQTMKEVLMEDFELFFFIIKSVILVNLHCVYWVAVVRKYTFSNLYRPFCYHSDTFSAMQKTKVTTSVVWGGTPCSSIIMVKEKCVTLWTMHLKKCVTKSGPK